MRPRLRPRQLGLLAIAASIPLLLGLNVWQGLRYTRLRESVRLLEEEQTAWYEKNKKLLAAIGIHSSPRRLEELAEQDDTVAKDGRDGVVRIELVSPGEAGKGQAR